MGNEDAMFAFLNEAKDLLEKYNGRIVAVCIATEVIGRVEGQLAIGGNLKVVSNNTRAGFDMIRDASERTQSFRTEPLPTPNIGGN
jgi:hypothetical protein